MASISEYNRGRRDGLRAAITCLHRLALGMDDPKAKAILNTAAHDLGVELRYRSAEPSDG